MCCVFSPHIFIFSRALAATHWLAKPKYTREPSHPSDLRNCHWCLLCDVLIPHTSLGMAFPKCLFLGRDWKGQSLKVSSIIPPYVLAYYLNKVTLQTMARFPTHPVFHRISRFFTQPRGNQPSMTRTPSLQSRAM